MTFRSNWYCTTDLDTTWDLRATGWRIAVAGDAPLDVDVYFPVPADQMGAVFPGYTANRAVNVVPYVSRRSPVSAPAWICRRSWPP